jgi:DNA-binding beta-propeller fold protein YncE
MDRARLTVVIGLVACGLLAPRPAVTDPGDFLHRYSFESVAPQDIAFDGEVYYITTFLDHFIYRYAADLQTLLPPYESPFQSWLGLTGIAYDSVDDTIWVIEPMSRKIGEISISGENEGKPTGRILEPNFNDVVGQLANPIPRGMTFYPKGWGGRGSFFIAENVGSLIYEVSLDGLIVQWFQHPDDPDGFPGQGETAPVYDVDLILDGQGWMTGLYVTGGVSRTDWIRRLDVDGAYNGYSIPLSRAGGTVSGFFVRDFTLPDGRTVRPAVVALVDSRAEIVVLDGSELPIPEILGFECSADGASVKLTWRPGDVYDRVEVYRDCRLRASLPGDPGQAEDNVAGIGVFRYRLKAYRGDHATESEERTIIVGGGKALRWEDFDGDSPVDLAMDPDGFFYICDLADNTVHVHGQDLKHLRSIEFNFLTEKDSIGGVAFNSADRTLFIYNSETNNISETDLDGVLLGAVGITLPNNPSNPRDEAFVTGLAFDPTGGPDGKGLFWFVELARELVYAVDRSGAIQEVFPHPVAARSALPPLSGLYNYMGGLSESPDLGFGSLLLTSGSLWEADIARIIWVDAKSGQEDTGKEIPLDGLDLVAPTNFAGIQAALHDGKPVVYAVTLAGRNSRIVELDATPPSPRFVTEVAARQQGREDDVVLTFLANDDYDEIRIGRECAPLAVLPAGGFVRGSNEYIDRGAPASLLRYDVQGIKGGVETDIRSARVRVDQGAVLSRSFLIPVTSPSQLARDPLDGSFLVASNSPSQSRSLFRFRPDLSFDTSIDDVVPEEWEIATMAVRPDGPASEKIHVIGWQKPSSIGGDQAFLMAVISRDGEPDPGTPFSLKLPAPPNGFMTYPAGLVWSASKECFYYIERNSQTIVAMDQNGAILKTIPHPASPLQSYVFNIGAAWDPENGTLLLTSAGPDDHDITTVVQASPGGRLTGVSIPLDTTILGSVTGIAVDGLDLVVAAYGQAAELIRLQAFLLPPPEGVNCSIEGERVRISWRNPATPLDAVVVSRDGKEIAVLPGSATEHVDSDPDRNRTVLYSVAGKSGGKTGKNGFCEVPALKSGFLRGDADENKSVGLTDAIVILEYLFLGGERPVCLDAADADDNGTVAITDAILVLNYLYLAGEDPSSPFPDPGQDPTLDAMDCF